MRSNFDAQLAQLNEELIIMGAMCEEAIDSSVKALSLFDAELAHQTAAGDSRIDEKEREIEALCLKMLLQQQPVARDLRLISAALKMITDMERIGDQAADIAELLEVLAGPVQNEHIAQMAATVSTMVTESIDAFVKHDLSLAEKVIADDDIADNLFLTVKNDLVTLIAEDKTAGDKALDILMIAKYLERIGDHATNIAEWVEFAITGKHKE
ncbi:MAG: phosphate signaling complex protein PhoU [Firmicutes bacterium]|nr:phosphate signaling complex protein PhoU [Bacillota bacterium]